MPLRRLAALVLNLPPDAAIWREDFLPPIEERLAQILERQDAWQRTMLDVQLGKKEIRVPGEIQIPRPGQNAEVLQPKKSKVETDIKKIAAWFGGATG